MSGHSYAAGAELRGCTRDRMAANPGIFTIWPFTESLCQPWCFFNLWLLGLCCCVQAFSSWREQGLLSNCGVKTSHCGGFSWLQSTGFRESGHQFLWCMGLVALRHVGSSHTRDQTCVSCIGRWILCHWSNGETQEPCLNCFVLGSSFPSRAVVCSKY